MVFHFKQRVEQLEKKHDDIAELCNSLINQVQMLTGVINTKHSKPVGFFPETNSKLTENITFSTSSPIPLDIPTTLHSLVPLPFPGEYKKIVVDDSILEEEELEWEEDDNVDMDLDVEENIDLNTEEDERILQKVNSEIEGEEVDLEDTENIEDFLEKKIENTLEELSLPKPKPENENVVVDSSIIPEPEQEPEQEEETNNENYQKMNVKQLKQIVQAKGLSSDASKLKRDELLRLLL